MARRALHCFAALFCSLMGLSGCHLCGTECQVTKVCCPEIKKEKIEKEGWDVECKQICIPPIHCPCSDPCECKCGKVIAVKKLKKDKIECGERCVVEYKLVDACCHGLACHTCPTCSTQSCGTMAPIPVEPAHELPKAEHSPIPTEPVPVPAVTSQPNVTSGTARVN